MFLGVDSQAVDITYERFTGSEIFYERLTGCGSFHLMVDGLQEFLRHDRQALRGLYVRLWA